MADKEGNLLPAYYWDREVREKHRELFQEATAEDALIDRYEASKESILNCFSTYTVLQKDMPECTISHDDLDKFIKQLFPYGQEQRGVGEKVFGSLKKVVDAIQAGLERLDASKLFGFLAGTDCAQVFQKEIKRCQMNLNVVLRENGAADLVAIMDRMKAPPYGWDTELHAAYCFGYVMHDYLDVWYWDGVGCFPMRDVAQSVLRNILTSYATSNIGRRRAFVLVTETGCKLSERFAYLFDIGTDEFCPRDETDHRILELHRAGRTERQIAEELGTMTNIAVHKRLAKMRTLQKAQIPFCNMAVKVIKKIEGMTQWPVSLVDGRLTEAIVGEFDDVRHLSVPIFGKHKTKEALSYFTVEKCQELKAVLADLDFYVSGLIRRRYGDSVDMEEIKSMCTTRSSGWLWDAETFWECVAQCIAKDGWYWANKS